MSHPQTLHPQSSILNRYLPEDICGEFVDQFPGGLMQKSREVDNMMSLAHTGLQKQLSPLDLLLRRPETGKAREWEIRICMQMGCLGILSDMSIRDV